jgi:hypothetical protein
MSTHVSFYWPEARLLLLSQEQNAATGRTYERIILEVGDDTRSSFSVSLWYNSSSSTIVAGDVLLLQSKEQRI